MFHSKFSIAAVGDLVPSRRMPANGEGPPGFEEAVESLRQADVAFGDLEMPLAAGGHPREKFIAFHAVPEIAQDLPGLGFQVLSLANNHSLDYGVEALQETMEGLGSAGIMHLGAGADLELAERPVVLNVAGGRVAFLAWSCLLPSGAAASSERPGLAPLHVDVAYEVDSYMQMEEPGNAPVVRTSVTPGDLQGAQERIRRLRGEVDFLAVSVHMGFGAGEELAEYQRPLCHALIDAGADIILGNHVHAIHAVEVYDGKAILYSPGNFIAQQPRQGVSAEVLALYEEMSREGYIAQVDVHESGSYSVHLVPTVTNDDGLPETRHGDSARAIGERIQRLSGLLGTKIAAVGDRFAVVGLRP